MTTHDPTATAPLPPVRRQVVVTATAARAFAAWTEELASWWPFATHSVCGQGATAAFVDGRLVETGLDGAAHVWGTVTVWEPGRRLAMTWHPGQSADGATDLDVQFDELDDGHTLVTVTHSGWERRPDAGDAREDYRTGWIGVLDRYGTRVGSTSVVADATGSTRDVWLVLQHTPWTPDDADVFSDPRFAGHIDFLRRMDAAGWLVAAGSLPDSPGSGMTVLHVPDDQLTSAVAAAQDDDLSVAHGLFGVRIRPWNVALASVS